MTEVVGTLWIEAGDRKLEVTPAVLIDPEAFKVTPAQANPGFVREMANRRDIARKLTKERMQVILDD